MEVRVYYEDTDSGGVVYYANYLRYLERGRTEFVRARGVSLQDLLELGYQFPVARLEIDYRFPAVYDDLIRITTTVLEVGNASLTLGHQVLRVADNKLLTEAQVTLACIGPGNRVRRLPAELSRILQGGRPETGQERPADAGEGEAQ